MSRVEPLNILNSQNDKRIPFRLPFHSSLILTPSITIPNIPMSQRFPVAEHKSLFVSRAHIFKRKKKHKRD